MDYLTNYYKNLSEQLQGKVNNIIHQLNEAPLDKIYCECCGQKLPPEQQKPSPRPPVFPDPDKSDPGYKPYPGYKPPPKPWEEDEPDYDVEFYNRTGIKIPKKKPIKPSPKDLEKPPIIR